MANTKQQTSKKQRTVKLSSSRKTESRVVLNTAIEKEVHNLLFRISENVYDFTHLYVRKQDIPIEHAQLEKTLEIVKLAIQESELKMMDDFHSKINNVLNDLTITEEEEALSLGAGDTEKVPLGSERKTSSQKALKQSPPLKKVSLSL